MLYLRGDSCNNLQQLLLFYICNILHNSSRIFRFAFYNNFFPVVYRFTGTGPCIQATNRVGERPRKQTFHDRELALQFRSGFFCINRDQRKWSQDVSLSVSKWQNRKSGGSYDALLYHISTCMVPAMNRKDSPT